MSSSPATERGPRPRDWVSLVPYGLNQQHPNNYKDILEAIWENRDSLRHAWRILNDGCCDGCALGTSGMHDWTMKGIHLCAVRLQLMRLNTMPAMDWRRLEDVAPLRALDGKALRKLGRLAVPMVRRRGDKGFQRVSWDEAIRLVPFRQLNLEQAIEFIADDEFVEVTPKFLRLRKKALQGNKRKKSAMATVEEV